MASDSPNGDTGVEKGQPSFKPYKSILKFSSSSSRLRQDQDEPSVEDVVVRPPPWRRPVGAAFFRHPFDSGNNAADPSEDLRYAEMMERTFAGFSDEVIGADVPIIDFRNDGTDASWGIDEDPDMPLVDGERPVLYHTADDVPVPPSAPTRHV